jgi:hypothetical protein
MKKKIIFFALISFTVLSCSKQEMMDPTGAKIETTPKKIRSHQVGKAPSKPCGGPGSNCTVLDTIVVHGRIDQIQAFHELVFLNGLAVKEYFTRQENLSLLESVDPSLKAKIVSGNYKLMIDYEDNSKIDLSFGSAQELTFSNSEFTLEYAK